MPTVWQSEGAAALLSEEAVPIVELAVTREVDVNRHAYEQSSRLATVIRNISPDVLDIHEEPFSVAARQWLAAAPAGLPIVMYTAQNIDKRFPPPFAQYERAALRRVAAMYPCTAQAASVARGKGFTGLIEVLPLGFEDAMFYPGSQSVADEELVLGLFGRLVPEKGVVDAVQILAQVHAVRPTRLVVVGSGPEEASVRALAAQLSVSDRLDLLPWQSTAELASTYRLTHVVLIPSRATQTWVEQFGRVIVEAQASGAVVAGYASGSIGEVAGEAALLKEVGDVHRLAADITELAADGTAFDERRARGIALSKTRTWTRVAERQADLYRRVAAGDVARVQQPRSPKRRRAAARAEFGPTAASSAGVRSGVRPQLRQRASPRARVPILRSGDPQLRQRASPVCGYPSCTAVNQLPGRRPH
ncbi:MAG: glycosyltransferase family 4 protein [Actinobacteria bacterium]|nr:glycosyltransferase family 4 protein [Actinomycetota bacterium]